MVVDPISNRRERFDVGSVHYAGDRELVILRARNQRGRWVVGYGGVTDLAAAEALRSVVLYGDPLDPGVLSAGEMWVHELIGAEVVDLGGTSHGHVADVEINPAHDILVLDTGGLVPVVFVSEFAPDPAPGRVVVDVPEGLLDEEFVAPNRAAVERRRPARKRPRP